MHATIDVKRPYGTKGIWYPERLKSCHYQDLFGKPSKAAFIFNFIYLISRTSNLFRVLRVHNCVKTDLMCHLNTYVCLPLFF